ncbi:MAG: arginine--tRNA ligase [Pirellulales bacterium]
MSVLRELQRRFAEALGDWLDGAPELLEMIRPAQDAKFGDYQANLAMPLGKKLQRSPREVATELVGRLKIDDLCEPAEIAGPGFINLRLSPNWLLQQVRQLAADPRLGVPPVAVPETIVVDFSSPNVAKPMHVGHIRSTVIGDALCRILHFVGHQVVSDNHLGDWGTQFGMIIYGYRNFVDTDAYQQRPVAELGRIYKLVRQLIDYQAAQTRLPVSAQRLVELDAKLDAQRAAVQACTDAAQAKSLRKALGGLENQRAELSESCRSDQALIQAVDSDPRLAQLAREHADINQRVLDETARLHAGDPDNRRLWEEFLPKCRQDIDRIYRRLGVTFDEELGESFYQDRLGAVVADLERRGLAVESEGAKCVFLEGFDAPMLIQKKDGAFLYATSDLATIAYRVERWQPSKILYVVDFRQGDHFAKLFAAARLWGYHDVDLRHVSFGTVLGSDGKPFKTRAGDTVGLEGLLDEAVARALEVVSANDDAKKAGPELSADQRARVAEVVGLGAIKYADLSQNRTSDYVFSYDKMIAMQGNTATYLQYSYARIQNIFAKAEAAGMPRPSTESAASLQLDHPSERALGLQLVRFAESLDEVLVDYRPNLLTGYLFELAKRFSEFYDACPVLQADDGATRQSRLQLCHAVGQTLRHGLSLLGIETVDKM